MTFKHCKTHYLNKQPCNHHTNKTNSSSSSTGKLAKKIDSVTFLRKPSTKMSGLCISRTATCVLVRVHSRVRSPNSKQCKETASFITAEDRSRLSESIELSFNGYSPEVERGNRVMIVVDSSVEAKGALDWALSHAVQSQDVIVLLHVAKQDGKSNGETDQRAMELLCHHKNICQLKRPEVHVEIVTRQGMEKGAVIVEEAKRLKVSLLVLGHLKRSLMWRLTMMWTSKRTRTRVVDYCIQNAHCLTIAVRREHRKYGGFLITTKRHKKFWQLA